MSQEVRTRFAPSPTGFLHVGGARTALFAYLYAKRHGGSFVLRIEDTDRQRSTDEAKEAILEGMQWLGLDWDEGPFFQTERNDLYKRGIDQLLAEGHVYKCTCTSQELEAMREQLRSEGKKPMYDGRCRDKDADPAKPFVLRFRVPEGETVVRDVVKGDVTFAHREIEDLVVARSDGTPTYNFVVVMDDHDMGISHVIRGDDHLNNTPKQILLYQALGFDVPVFAHVPLILGEDKKRLSKRHGATSVMAYREEGYLPHAMVNFLVRLGWSQGDQEIFSLSELKSMFGLEHIGKSAGIFNPKKLLWLNQHYIKEAKAEFLLDEIKHFSDVDPTYLQGDTWKAAIESMRERAKTTKELAELSEFYFCSSIELNPDAASKFLTREMRAPFKELQEKLEGIDFEHDAIKAVFDEVLASHDLKMKSLAQPLRVALTGKTVSPSIFEVMELIGKDRTMERLDRAMASIK